MAKSFFSRHFSQYKDSFFDYFDKKDQENVLQILNRYKIINHEYYKILIKKYGKNYNQLNKNILLSEKEEKKFNRLKINIRKILKELNCGKTIEDSYIQYQKIFHSFYDYFDESDRIYVKQIIEAYSYFKNDYYEILVKKFGDCYDSLNLDVETTEEEEKTLISFKKILKKKIRQIKAGDTLYEVLPRKYKLLVSSENYLDQFPKKYKNLVIDIIEKYKNSEYYSILVKKYGINYNCCNSNVFLTEEENNKLNYLTSNIKYEINQIKIKKTKCIIDKSTSFYNFFDEKDYSMVTKILGEYKKINHKYYQLTVKKYGENYNNVDLQVELTKEEKQKIRTFINLIKEQIKKINSGKRLEETLPYNEHHYYKSFLTFFDKNQQEDVIHILDQFQVTNPDYYQLVVKKYGKNYDTINLEIELTSEEKDLLLTIRKKIQKKLSKKYEVRYCFKQSMSMFYRMYPKLKQESNKNLVVLTCFIDKNMTVDEISSLTKLPLKTIDSIIVSHLYLFQENTSKIIDDVLERGYYTPNQIVNIISLRGQIQYLNSLKSEIERLTKEKTKK